MFRLICHASSAPLTIYPNTSAEFITKTDTQKWPKTEQCRERFLFRLKCSKCLRIAFEVIYLGRCVDHWPRLIKRQAWRVINRFSYWFSFAGFLYDREIELMLLCNFWPNLLAKLVCTCVYYLENFRMIIVLFIYHLGTSSSGYRKYLMIYLSSLSMKKNYILQSFFQHNFDCVQFYPLLSP